MTERPTVLVMSCRGADQGAMSAVRTLGRRGVRVSVLSDHATCLTRYSRFCQEFVCRPDFTQDTEATLDWLLSFAARQDVPPVLFPTADPDLALVARLRTRLEGPYRLFLGNQDLVDTLQDKIRFMDLAVLHDFPVPATHAPESRREFLAVSEVVHYPVVLKPAHPAAWTHPRLQAAVDHQKALIVSTADELRSWYEVIAPWNADLLVQEYIVGPDDNHFSAHVYIGRNHEPLACFTGRKVRVQPAFAGSGCYVRSEYVPELVSCALDVLRAVRYTGVAVLNFKQDSRTGRFLLHEINPRISQWNILATRAGVDVPWAAYADAAGLPVTPMREQRSGIQYVDLLNDLKAWRQYRRAGQWSVGSYVQSLLSRRTVHQLLAFDDPVPFLRCLDQSIHARVRRWIGRPPLVEETPFLCEIDAVPSAPQVWEYGPPQPVRECRETGALCASSDPASRRES